ncbi:MAG: diaminopimelate epimerase [bacterium]
MIEHLKPIQKKTAPGGSPDFFQYHGLGNVYLVIEPGRFVQELTEAAVRDICHPHLGVGADGVLVGPAQVGPAQPAGGAAVDDPGAASSGGGEGHAVRIFNSDGSEAEKSGNGLRIFARFLWEHGYASESPFSILTAGGVVRARMSDPDGGIALEMGPVRFDSPSIPMTGPAREVLQEALTVEGREFTISAANVGNPHCVVEVEGHPESDGGIARMAREFGPLIEHHPSFPNRTNVQFLTVIDSHRIRIEIWERGSGYTLSSGTSSCAASAVACRLGRCVSPITVEMPGGNLTVRLDADFNAELEGPVVSVAAGRFADEFLAHLGLTRR